MEKKLKPQNMLKFCANLEVNLIKEKQNIFFDNVCATDRER